MATPSFIISMMEKNILKNYDAMDKDYIDSRVNYYNQLSTVEELPNESYCIGNNSYFNKQGPSVYFFDTFEYTRYFPKYFKWIHIPGDVNFLVDSPSIVKTRPLCPDNPMYSNSIILNLDKVRHFFFVKDNKDFLSKKKMVVFRGDIFNKPKRIEFIYKYINEPIFNIGDTSGKLDESIQKNRMTKAEHLEYRYIMSLEGNDVATNLKWVMSSNSIAVMPRPTCESWFMEGRLIPNYHYIEIKDDFSDISDRIAYYNEHENEALAIIEHAHEWVEQFKDKKREDVISYLVLKKYFQHTSFNGKVQLE